MQVNAEEAHSVPRTGWDAVARWGAVVALLVGVFDAWRLRWTCDDAFISFRYARNLVRGLGLVFNEAEAVEGYTNFLWTLGIAGGLALGIDPISWTHAMGLLGWLAVGGLIWHHARQQGRMPVGAWVWAAFPYGRVFATSGLETMGFTALSLGAMLHAFKAVDRKQATWVSLLAVLSLMMRPEGGLTVMVVMGTLALRSRRLAAAALMPLAVLVVPWLVFKLSFYGELLPNTWYAKAGAGPRWDAGWAYLALFFGANGVLAAGVLGWLTRSRAGRARWMQLAVVGWLAVYMVHIARAGGDFMYARFCVPLVPWLCLGLGRLVEQAVVRAPRFGVVALLVPVGVLLAQPPAGIFGDVHAEEVGTEGVVDERSWYPPEAIALAKEQGERLRGCVSKTPVRAVYYGTQAMLMYYSDLPYALEPHVGLTDWEVARMPPPAGVRVGHGQKADTDYLRSRSIDLALGYRLQLPTTQVTQVQFPGGMTGRMLTYRRPVVEALRACGARVLDFEAFLDQWLPEMHTMDDDKVRKAWDSFSAYYFDHNDDPAREAPFRARLGLPERQP